MRASCPLAVCLLLAALLVAPAVAAEPPPKGPLLPASSPIQHAIGYLLEQVDDDGCIGGARVTAWAAMALVAADHDPYAPAPSGATIVDGLKACQPGRVIQGEELTAIQRHLLAIIAVGGDPHSFNGRDWEQEVRSRATSQGFFDPGNPNSLNNDFFGILSLSAAGADPQDPAIMNAADRLLANQNSDGGWSHSASLTGGTSDTDMTAAALMALARAERLHPDHPTLRSALDYLQQRAHDTDDTERPGCLSTRTDLPNPDMDSTSWAILGLLAMHEDPRAAPWTHQQTPWECLLSMQHESGGFPPASGANPSPWPTTYAVLALTGAPFATVHPAMVRPTAELHLSHTPIDNQRVHLLADGAVYASWLAEDHHAPLVGTNITWTPTRPGVHNFSVLLLDPHGLANLQQHPIMVLPPAEQPPEDDHKDPTDTARPTDPFDPVNLTIHITSPWPAGSPLTLRVDGGHESFTYRIDWADGNTTSWMETTIFTHTYDTPGTYTISAWARTPHDVLHGPDQAVILITAADATATDEATQSLHSPRELSAPVIALFLVPLVVLLHRAARRATK